MSKSYANIEKLCLEELHDGYEDVCNFEKDGNRYVSDGYAVWVFPEEYGCSKTYVKYPNKGKMLEKILSLVKEYKDIEPIPLRPSGYSVITRQYSASEYESYLTGNEVWMQGKYITLFEPFNPTFCMYADWDEWRPIIVTSGKEFIGLIMPMHMIDEVKKEKVQEKL